MSKQLKAINLIPYTFIPAILIETSYILFVNLTDRLHLPNLNALALAVVFVMIPVEFCLIAFYSKKEHGIFNIKTSVEYKNKLSIKQYLLIVTTLFIYMALVFYFAKPFDLFIKEHFFTFIPNKYVLQVNIDTLTRTQLAVSTFSAMFITGILAPIVEEVYFRGFLLPKMEWMGKAAPFVNAILFALYHFWSPWQTPSRIIALIPLCYVSYKTKNIKVTIIVHCMLNIIGDALVFLFALF